MMKNIKNMLMAGLMGCTISVAFNSCKEDIDESNLYTFTGETIESYLQKNSDQFSNFNYILSRIGYDRILSAYGNYTCFAPVNEAVTAYIDSLYNDTSNKDFEHNGMTGPGLEGLTDSLCKDIALFHLHDTKVMGVNMGNGMIIRTMLGRDIITSLDSVSASVVINRKAQITGDGMDKEMENGVLHVLNHVITRSNNLVAGELETHDNLSLFTQALKLTTLADSLADVSVLAITQGDTVATTRHKRYKVPSNLLSFYVPETTDLGYTLFAETNDVLAEHDINTIEDLINYANRTYGRCAVEKNSQTMEGWYDYYRNKGIEVSTGTDYQSPYNALNMFMRYHIIKCKVPYEKLTNSGLNEVTLPPNVLLYEYYETMLPYTLLKVSRHSGERYINYWQTNNTLTNRVAYQGYPSMYDVRSAGIKVTSRTGQIQALNGYIHPISDMLVYNWNVPNGTLNERMRFDICALFGEMISNSFRLMSDDEVKARNGGVSGTDGNLGGNYFRIPQYMLENLYIYNDESTRLYYLPGRSNTWSNYQGDEFNCKGDFDFALRLPPVPDGTYEVRLGYTANGNRGMLQFYLGTSSQLTSMKALDIPLDMRFVPTNNTDGTPDTRTGWCLWTNTSDQGVESDANMRSLGYMRGPLYYTVSGSTLARSNNQDLRRILTRQQFEQGEYWLRFKTVLPGYDAQFHLDYIEFCPETVYNNTLYAEDMY